MGGLPNEPIPDPPCGVVERRDHHCGDDLVMVIAVKLPDRHGLTVYLYYLRGLAALGFSRGKCLMTAVRYYVVAAHTTGNSALTILLRGTVTQ